MYWWMDVSDAKAFLHFQENEENKNSQMEHTIKIF
jgi:hypothetical protein